MKVIQIMPEFGLAGAETMCENLTYELKKQGIDVVVISLYDFHSPITERMESAGIKVCYLNKKPRLDLSMIYKLYRIFKEEQPDAIHTHRYVMQYAIPAAILGRVKHRVHTVHNIAEKENSKIARKFNKLFYKFAHVIPVALSGKIQDTIVAEYHIRKEKIPVIYNGIDFSKCQPKTDYSIEENFKILHIGRFSEQKNHIGLLKAFYLFHEKFPNCMLYLIGDGEKRNKAEQFVNKHGISNCVKFLGVQSNVYGYLHDADLFTLPSLYEGIPMTLIEAMGTGVPIVATDVGGVTDMLTNYDNSLLTTLDTLDICSAFIKYAQDESLRRIHGEKVKDLAFKFSSKTMAQKYVEVYQY